VLILSYYFKLCGKVRGSPSMRADKKVVGTFLAMVFEMQESYGTHFFATLVHYSSSSIRRLTARLLQIIEVLHLVTKQREYPPPTAGFRGHIIRIEGLPRGFIPLWRPFLLGKVRKVDTFFHLILKAGVHMDDLRHCLDNQTVPAHE